MWTQERSELWLWDKSGEKAHPAIIKASLGIEDAVEVAQDIPYYAEVDWSKPNHVAVHSRIQGETQRYLATITFYDPESAEFKRQNGAMVLGDKLASRLDYEQKLCGKILAQIESQKGRIVNGVDRFKLLTTQKNLAHHREWIAKHNADGRELDRRAAMYRAAGYVSFSITRENLGKGSKIRPDDPLTTEEWNVDLAQPLSHLVYQIPREITEPLSAAEVKRMFNHFEHIEGYLHQTP